jgi:hypothetical protein
MSRPYWLFKDYRTQANYPDHWQSSESFYDFDKMKAHSASRAQMAKKDPVFWSDYYSDYWKLEDNTDITPNIPDTILNTPLDEYEKEEMQDKKSEISACKCMCGSSKFEVFMVSSTIWYVYVKCTECGKVSCVATE